MVFLTTALLAVIDAHARAAAPHECCGLLIGTTSGDDITIARAEPTRNAAPEPARRYLIDPEDHFRILRAVRDAERARPACAPEATNAPAGSTGSAALESSDASETASPPAAAEHAADVTAAAIDAAASPRASRPAPPASQETAGFAIVGGYHSHPASSPIPSPTDLAEALPHFLYLIVTPRPDGAGGCDVRAWQLIAGNFQEAAIVVLP